MEYYIHFIQEHDLGNFALTKASQAFNAFRHRFKDEKLVIHKKQKVKELERLAYTGGRCEAFHIGEPEGGPFISLDINSMYPYVMKEFEYPVELVEYTENPALERFNNVLLTHAVVAEVEIQTDEPAYALKYNGKTVFPTGSFTTWVTTPGMKYALEHGHIKKVNRAAIYRKAPLFARYVDYFYNLKLQYKSQGNQMMTLFTKYMLNSLYGKFGQKKPVTDEYQTDTGREYSREEILDVDTGDVYTVTSLMNKMIVQKGETEGYMSFPAIAAHVTEYGRFMLWQIIKQTGPENVLYCDTDSIKICKSDIDKVKWSRSETTLGALKIEDETDYLYIGGAKNYITDTARKIKGIPSKAKEISPGVYRFPVFYRQNTHLRNGSPAGVTVGNMVRSLKGSYDKGIVTGSGQVFPYHFSDVDSPPS
jgi:DNA polymerase elongation subunit (family B)